MERSLKEKASSFLRRFSFIQKVGLAVLCTVLVPLVLALCVGILSLALVFVPPVFGIRQLWFTRPQFFSKKPEGASDFIYEPKQSIGQKALGLLKSFLKLALFPLYIWGLGIKVLLMRAIYLKMDLRGGQAEAPPRLASMDLDIKPLTISMPGDIKLYTVEISKKVLPSPETRKYVIFFGGNSTKFGDSYGYEATRVAKETGAIVIGFHHSGFGASGRQIGDKRFHVPATSIQTLVEEGKAQVERLKQAGVPAKNITLYGHSLGGAISALVAAESGCKLVSHASFSSVTKIVMGWLLLPNPDDPPKTPRGKVGYVIQTAAAYLLKPIIKGILWCADCEMEGGDAFASLSAQDRKYFVVRSRCDGGGILEDEIIPYSASIHQHPKIRKERKDAHDKSGKMQSDCRRPHCASFFSLTHYEKEKSPVAASDIFKALVTR